VHTFRHHADLAERSFQASAARECDADAVVA